MLDRTIVERVPVDGHVRWVRNSTILVVCSVYKEIDAEADEQIGQHSEKVCRSAGQRRSDLATGPPGLGCVHFECRLVTSIESQLSQDSTALTNAAFHFAFK